MASFRFYWQPNDSVSQQRAINLFLHQSPRKWLFNLWPHENLRNEPLVGTFAEFLLNFWTPKGALSGKKLIAYCIASILLGDCLPLMAGLYLPSVSSRTIASLVAAALSPILHRPLQAILRLASANYFHERSKFPSPRNV